jgi:hypothetical protein
MLRREAERAIASVVEAVQAVSNQQVTCLEVSGRRRAAGAEPLRSLGGRGKPTGLGSGSRVSREVYARF